MSEKQIKLSLPIGKDREYFVPEIVIDDKDWRSTPVVYLPFIFDAQAEPLLPELEKIAWKIYCKDYTKRSKDRGSGCEEEEEEEDDEEKGVRRESLSSKNVIGEYIFISLDEDEGSNCVWKTKPLKLARYGCQIVKIYGPEKIKSWEYKPGYTKTTDKETGETSRESTAVLKEVDVDLAANEKIICFNHLNEKVEDLEEVYGVKLKEKKVDHKGRGGNFEFEMDDEDFKKGRFNQQQSKTDTADLAVYSTQFKFGEKIFKRFFHILGNRQEYRGEQVKKIGRKTEIIRETLIFNGDTEKTIKYWYDDPVVTVLSWTDIIDVDGRLLEYRPNNAPPGDDDDKFGPKRGRTYYAEKPCWGSLLVEYETTYSEFRILYDFKEPRRYLEVLAGNIEKIGYITLDMQDKVVERGNALEENDLGHDRTVTDIDWLERNEDKTAGDDAPEVALKLLKKIQYRPFTTESIQIFYTNGRQTATAQFTPPTPDFMAIPTSELPRIAIFEQRRQEKTPGGATVEHIEEITFVDVMGNVISEKLERRKDESSN